jgi:hypothetical protein
MGQMGSRSRRPDCGVAQVNAYAVSFLVLLAFFAVRSVLRLRKDRRAARLAQIDLAIHTLEECLDTSFGHAEILSVLYAERRRLRK